MGLSKILYISIRLHLRIIKVNLKKVNFFSHTMSLWHHKMESDTHLDHKFEFSIKFYHIGHYDIYKIYKFPKKINSLSVNFEKSVIFAKN